MEVICYGKSPIGNYCLRETDGRLTRVWLGDRLPFISTGPEIKETPLLRETKAQLNAYFNRQLRSFNLPIAVEGTDFQVRIWNLLKTIPYGQTITYGELACLAGNPKACRAVGTANGHNPLPVILPCHRVIGSKGKLTGYTGGLDIKIKLLQIEGQELDFKLPEKPRLTSR